MKKSSIYLTDEERDRLKKLAKKEGRSQSEVIRSAIGSYADSRPSDRNFSMAGAWEGNGSSVADIPEDELLKGFGD